MHTISGYNIRGGNLRNNGMYEDPKSIKNEFDRNCVSQQPFYFHVHFIFIIKCSRSLFMFFIKIRKTKFEDSFCYKVYSHKKRRCVSFDL